MKYKIGDKVRVRGDLEVGWYSGYRFSDEMIGYKNSSFTIKDIFDGAYVLKETERKYYFTEDMFRSAEFKIWCETETEKQAVLEELEKEGYTWAHGEKMTAYDTIAKSPIGLVINDFGVAQYYVDNFNTFCFAKLSPSEFTGIDFSEKIIITKTPTGATATYGEKTLTTEGEFIDASRQALAEVLCPFKVGDKVKRKVGKTTGKITRIDFVSEILVDVDGATIDAFSDYELEHYTEPSYNARLFCIKGSNDFEQGRIYEVENGMLEINSHKTRWVNLKDINSHLHAQFMEVKDD